MIHGYTDDSPMHMKANPHTPTQTPPEPSLRHPFSGTAKKQQQWTVQQGDYTCHTHHRPLSQPALLQARPWDWGQRRANKDCCQSCQPYTFISTIQDSMCSVMRDRLFSYMRPLFYSLERKVISRPTLHFLSDLRSLSMREVISHRTHFMVLM